MNLRNSNAFWQPTTAAELLDRPQNSASFAMPSLFEGLGLSMQEAPFKGCSCGGARCGGVEDLIQDGDNGPLAAAGKVALEQLIGDARLRERFSRRTPRIRAGKKMTVAAMATAYEQLYAEILTGDFHGRASAILPHQSRP